MARTAGRDPGRQPDGTPQTESGPGSGESSTWLVADLAEQQRAAEARETKVLRDHLVRGDLGGIHRRIEEARASKTRSEARTIAQAIAQYEIHCGGIPTQSGGLQALVGEPSDLGAGAHWHGPYFFKGVPKDGWDRDYVYRVHGSGYEVLSLGSDGQEGTEDDSRYVSEPEGSKPGGAR
jgi:type II secretion system protein G